MKIHFPANHPGCNCPSCVFFRSFLDGKSWISGSLAHASLYECAQKRISSKRATGSESPAFSLLGMAMRDTFSAAEHLPALE